MKKRQLFTVKKNVRVLDKNEADSADIDFWANKSPEEKLDALQIIREQQAVYMNKSKANLAGRKGFRRVHRITQ